MDPKLSESISLLFNQASAACIVVALALGFVAAVEIADLVRGYFKPTEG
jgi:hypothetical protein